MAVEVSNLALPLDFGLAGGEGLARKALSQVLGLRQGELKGFRLTRRSVDARKKDRVRFVGTFVVELDERAERRVLGRRPRGGVRVRIWEEPAPYEVPDLSGSGASRPVVVGFGPAGIFAALVLARAGLRPIVLERGDDAFVRRERVRAFEQGGALDPESNVQFGEGGAGTFSDGKLTTGIKDPRCRSVLEAFASAGAPSEILWLAKPHIGTDLLPDVVASLRRRIEELGGEVRFRSRMTEALREDGRVRGLLVHEGPSGSDYALETDALIVACGHSARDSFQILRDAGCRLERKPFAMGLRIEHLQSKVNEAQYGPSAGHPALGAADYKLAVHLSSRRGVYTFCMCPGGEVVCAASEEGGVCVNGMSRFARDGANANAALLVEIRPDDLPGTDAFEGLRLQRRLEQQAYRAGGSDYRAPAQRLGDFLACHEKRRAAALGEAGEAMPQPSYARGVTWCDLHEALPGFICDAIAEALPLLDAKLRGFADPDAVMTAVEARSSSPIRVVRDKETLQSSLKGLFPAGEGAGYAGGIMSAAVDGMRAAEALIAHCMHSEQE